ncbi:metal-sensing transcriptional repressor [Kordiimonas pumila]|uniref:Metal-sensing transcriptional repressor n=1 Tax=Kordiimonas pumila TaxID=2161677 RepID=A0ABV7D1I0_9PROT|nr:metal-sensing transcriptional repressor [Kordiimonas pumila]
MIAEKDKTAMLNRLARVEGQLRGIQKLILAGEEDCEKVAQQMSAARKALDKAGHTMLACMIEEQIRVGKTDNLSELGLLIGKYA